MIDRSFTRPHPWRVWALATVVFLPTLLLAGFGLFSLRRDQDIAVHEARQSARVQARRLVEFILQGLANLSLPSALDVAAFDASPGAPGLEPLARLAAAPNQAIGVLVRSGGVIPDDRDSPALPPRFAPSQLPPEPYQLWREAESSEFIAQDLNQARKPWEELLDKSKGADWEIVVRFRLARTELLLGRTRDARERFEAAAAATPQLAGETGLPLDVLALRALLQIAEIDRDAATHRTAWLDALCHRVLIRWRLPGSLLEEWEPGDSERIRQWRDVAGIHATAAMFARCLPPGFKSLETQEARWMTTNGGDSWLLTSHPVTGGTWQLFRGADWLRGLVATNLAAQGLPDYAGARVAIAGRDLTDASSEAEELATATGGCVTVRLGLEKPELLFARQRVRSRVFGGLIAMAAVTVMAGYIAGARAYRRQRQLAELQADFVASVSHELRAPLAAVRLMAEELTDLPPQFESRRVEYHRLILRETRRLALLIENVLRHARLERGRHSLDRTSVDVGVVVRAAVEGLQPCAVERDLRIEARLPERPVVVEADAQALQQVLINLLDNAIKHSPSGATVSIGLENASMEPPADLCTAAVPRATQAGRPRDCARIWVADQGAGIPQKDHRRIFDSFYRRGGELRRETPGVGLGLAIVKRLVEAHGGSVGVASQSGSGCRFTVELPISRNHDL